MKIKEMEKLTKHCDLYFEQTEHTVLHPIAENELHIDVLLYSPNEKYPFWKLVTMGASDYKMPAVQNTVGLYNEYMMFVAPDVDLTNKDVLKWYYNKLLLCATFAYYNKTHITYAHSFEWENKDPNDEMIGAFIEFPQIIETPDVLHCKLGLLKTVACLQVVLLNKQELNMLMEIGPQAFSCLLYPEDGSYPHFLSEQHRSEKF
ncbi:MAG: suppressor of fused domain protein [Clostridia bacterium]|nr:suppressor of fused domain protein [Clostridia bacterium]MBR5485184.1 suppressor of fused domain protein [Oscillospiraceae bacterium]